MLSVRTLAAGAVFVIACGDASNISSNHWSGIGTGGGDDNGSSDGGSSSSDSGATDGGVLESGVQSASFDILTDKTTYSVELRSTVTVQVTVAPKSFTGTVTLGTTGLPTGVTAAFAPPTLSVAGTTGATSVLTLTTISSIAPGNTPFQVTGVSGSSNGSVASALTVMPQITIQIPLNVDALKGTSGSPSTNAFGDYPIVITAPGDLGTADPVVVKFVNNDSAPHCIHASNPNQGFPHDAVTNGVCNALMNKGGTDATAHNVNTKGSYLFYIHDQGDLTDGMIKVQ